MHEIHKGLPFRDFVRPQSGLVTATVCKKSGLLPTEYCNEGTVALEFLEGTQPTSYCTYHERHDDLKRVAMDRLQQESYSVGQRPINVDTSALTLDPDIFTDPEPRRRSGFFRSDRSSSSMDQDETVPEMSYTDEEEADTTQDEDMAEEPYDIPEPSGPAFNPLLE